MQTALAFLAGLIVGIIACGAWCEWRGVNFGVVEEDE
jgi:hypothetical protein